MKLIYIANIRIPTEKAHGIQIVQMCSAFVHAGVEVELIVPVPIKDLGKPQESFEYYGVEKNFTITALPIVDPRWALHLPKKLGTYIRLKNKRFAKKLHEHFQRNKISTGAKLYTRDEALLKTLQQIHIEVVWEAHTLPQHTQKSYLPYWKTVKTIVAITGQLKKELTSLGVSPDQIAVIPDGVTLERYEGELPDPYAKKFPHTASRIVYTGHLYGWKGAGVLAQAAGLLKSKAAVLFLGGTGADIAAFKKKHAHTSSVHVLGRKPHKDIPAYQKHADILVLPNSASSKISTTYTSPLKLFEYMASGRPIIASDIPSIREILSDTNAFLAPPDSPEKLAEMIEFVLANPEEAEKRARQARKEVEHYTWDERAHEILNQIIQ